MDTRQEVEHFRLFSIFLAAGLVDMSSESLNFPNALNTGKQMYLYPKMASKLDQHLLRAKSKAENSGLFTIYFAISLLFFQSALWLPHGQLLSVIKKTVLLTQC